MDDLLEQDLFDAQDAKDVSLFPRYMIRNRNQPDAYWSDEGGWTTFTEADTYQPIDLEAKHIPADGEWLGLEETALRRVEPETDLKTVLGVDFVNRLQLDIPGYLVQYEWLNGGGQCKDRWYCGPMMRVRAALNGEESSQLYQTDDKARELRSLVDGLIPKANRQSVHCWAQRPFLDRWNDIWVFEVCLAAANPRFEEINEDFRNPYGDLEFNKPEALSETGESAYNAIVGVLHKEALRSVGSAQVFHHPATWELDEGKDAELIVVHETGDHAPYFNFDYQDCRAQAKMRTALAGVGMVLEQITPWFSAVYLANDATRLLEVMEPDDQDDLKDATLNPTVQKFVEILRGASEEHRAFKDWRMVGEPKAVTNASGDAGYEIAFEDLGDKRSHKLATLLGRKAMLLLRRDLHPTARCEMHFDPLQTGRWTYTFWVPNIAVSEAEDELDPKDVWEPQNKFDRIQLLFSTMGLQIINAEEVPADPKWGDLGRPHNFIASVILPDVARHGQWVINPMATPELGEFLTRVKSNLGEILGTTDVDYTTRFSKSRNVWSIWWFVGDVPVRENLEDEVVIQEDSAEGDDNRVAIVGVFREKDGKHECLIAKREVDPAKGEWCIPGGHVQVGEKNEDGARREMQEETHLDLGELTFVKKMPNETREAEVFVYGAMMPEGDKPRAGDDAEKLKWVPLDDLPKLAFDNQDLIREIADKMGFSVEEVKESSLIEALIDDDPGDDWKDVTFQPPEGFTVTFLRRDETPADSWAVWKFSVPTKVYSRWAGEPLEFKVRKTDTRYQFRLAVPNTVEPVAYLEKEFETESEALKFGFSFAGWHSGNYKPPPQTESLFERLVVEDKATNKYGKDGLLVVFEGIDGAGKTTQVKRLAEWLNDKDYSYVTTKWNSSKVLSDALWKAKKKKLLNPMSFSLLHASDMHIRYDNLIVPALKKGKVLICDRYYYTSYVRDQIRDIPIELIDEVYKDFRKPDLIFHCKVPVKIAVERLMADRGVGYYSSGQDVGYHTKGIEKTTTAYETDMAKRYDELFKNERNVVELDMDRPVKEIAKDVKKEVRKRLGLNEALDDDDDTDWKDVAVPHDWSIVKVPSRYQHLYKPGEYNLRSNRLNWIMSVRPAVPGKWQVYLSSPGSTFATETLAAEDGDGAIRAAIEWAEKLPQTVFERERLRNIGS